MVKQKFLDYVAGYRGAVFMSQIVAHRFRRFSIVRPVEQNAKFFCCPTGCVLRAIMNQRLSGRSFYLRSLVRPYRSYVSGADNFDCAVDCFYTQSSVPFKPACRALQDFSAH